MKILGDKSLKELTTFKIGGIAKYYAEVETEDEILEVAKFVKANDLKIFILGGGSDVLINDNVFDGIVVKFIGQDIKIEGNTIIADAGLSWDKLVALSIDNNLQGIECLSGIPGTVGASPVQNIGAFGQEVADVFLGLRAFEFKSGKFINFSKEDCQFGYRESFFKKPKNWQQFLITSVSFKLKKDSHPRIKYESLLNYLNENNIKNPSLKEIRNAVLNLRKEKLENPESYGNAGSFFKNPVIDKEIPGVPSYPFGSKYKLFSGWLIDKAGWKGKTYKGAGVSSKNALFLINKTGTATSSDIVELSELIIDDVKNKFGVTLEREVQLINF